MSKLLFMVTITGRDRLADIMTIRNEEGAGPGFVTLGHGTATGDIRSLLGLTETEKAVSFSIITDEIWQKIRKRLVYGMKIDVPGTGVAFTVPVSSIAGKREFAFLTAGMNYEREEETSLKQTERELLIAICDQGYNETVMEAAKSGGASGGTFIHAKGTGMNKAEQFFGVTLASEKDIIFIVTRTEQKNAIMQAILEKAGPSTRAKGIVFSLPVTDTAGMRLLDERDDSADNAESKEQKN